MKKWFLCLNASEKIAFSALIVAISSIILTIWQINAIQKHNKLTIKPIVLLTTYYKANSNEIGFGIYNLGNGPAIVKSFSVNFDNKKVYNWEEVISYLDIDRTKYFYFKNYPNGVVLNTDTDIDKGKALNFIPLNFKKSKKILENIILEMRYCSLYNECWIVDSNNTTPVEIEEDDKYKGWEGLYKSN